MHYTDTTDHLVVTHGTFELVLHDGSKREVSVGDVITQLGGVHQWNNNGDEWASKWIPTLYYCKQVIHVGLRIRRDLSTVETSHCGWTNPRQRSSQCSQILVEVHRSTKETDGIEGTGQYDGHVCIVMVVLSLIYFSRFTFPPFPHIHVHIPQLLSIDQHLCLQHQHFNLVVRYDQVHQRRRYEHREHRKEWYRRWCCYQE